MAALGIAAAAVLVATLLVRPQGDWKDGSPAWSPDATRIAFYSERDGNAEIYVGVDGLHARARRSEASCGGPRA